MNHQYMQACPRDCLSKNLTRLAVAIFALGFVTVSPEVSQGQITKDTGQPPKAEEPKPRFPQLPGDRPDPKALQQSPPESPMSVEDEKELVGRIVKIEEQKLTVEPNRDKSEQVVIGVKSNAKVTLNRKPATLADLEPTDFVRISRAIDNPDMAAEVAAARVIHDTLPADPAPQPRRRPIVNQREPMPNQQGGLGLVVTNSPNQGILILDVHRETPAWMAGIQTGDYLLELHRKEILTPDDFLSLVRQHEPNESVEIVLWRNGKLRKGMVELTTSEAARDREATDARVHIAAETHGDDTVVIKRTPGRTETLDREPDQSTIVLDREPKGRDVVLDRRPAELPEDYDELAKQYRLLHQRITELEQELTRIRKEQ